MANESKGLVLVPERFKQLVAGLIAYLVRKFSTLSRIVGDIGEIASFHLYIHDRFGNTKFFLTRERLILQCIREYKPEAIYEFGVSNGDLCRFILRKNSYEFEYFGFDSFEGLPSDWIRGGIKYLPKGAFSREGIIPDIRDNRLTFVKGIIEKNLPELNSLIVERNNRLFIFDMDLYEPSRDVFDFLNPKLKEGDLVIFDQAFDSHNERRIVEDKIRNEKRFQIIGVSGIAVAFRVF
jgi:hypothetical protein